MVGSFKNVRWKVLEEYKTVFVVAVDDSGMEIYDFAIDRCKTDENLLMWVRQIEEKNWSDKDCLRSMLEAIYEAKHGKPWDGKG